MLSRTQVEVVEAELGLEKRPRLEAQAFTGVYRGYRVKVVSEGADEAGGGGGTWHTVYLDDGVVGPPGFRRLRFPSTLRKRAERVKVGAHWYTADEPAEIDAWLTPSTVSFLENNADLARRDFRRITMRRGWVRSAAEVQKGLERTLQVLEDLRHP